MRDLICLCDTRTWRDETRERHCQVQDRLTTTAAMADSNDDNIPYNSQLVRTPPPSPPPLSTDPSIPRTPSPSTT